MGASAVSHPGTLPYTGTSVASNPASRRGSALVPVHAASSDAAANNLVNSNPRDSTGMERHQAHPGSDVIVIPGYVWSMQADGEMHDDTPAS